MLHGDWGKNNATQKHLTVLLTRFENAIAVKRSLPDLILNIKYLIKLLADPWGNPTVTKIFHSEEFSNEEGKYEC